MRINTDLEALGLTSEQMSDYWRQRSAGDVCDILDASRVYDQAQLNTDIEKIQYIIDTTTNPEVKDIAKITKRILKYLRGAL